MERRGFLGNLVAIPLAFSGKSHKWDWREELKSFPKMEDPNVLFRSVPRSEVIVTKNIYPVHQRYCRFLGLTNYPNEEILDVQTYGLARPGYKYFVLVVKR